VVVAAAAPVVVEALLLVAAVSPAVEAVPHVVVSELK
jgi:hypothetical protein